MRLYDLVIGQLIARDLIGPPQRNGFHAQCPAHKDSTPSLSVRQAPNGGVYLKCFKGCTYQQIRDALAGTTPSPYTSAPLVPAEEWVHCTPARLPGGEPLHPILGKPVGMWAYKTLAGGIWAIVCRFATPKGKEIRPLALYRLSTTGELKWRWSCPPGPRPLLYWSTHYMTAPSNSEILVVEGEKAADAADYYIPAVTWLGGSSAVDKTDWSPLAGRDVILLPDFDEPGRRCMWQIAERLVRLGARVRFAYPPPGVPEGWDCADPMPEGWTLRRILEDSDVAWNTTVGFQRELRNAFDLCERGGALYVGGERVYPASQAARHPGAE